MKKITTSLFFTSLLISKIHAASVAVSGGFVTNLNGSTISDPKPNVGDLVIIVASSSNNTFENILAGDSLTVGSTVGGGDDIIIASDTVFADGVNRVGQGAFSGVQISTAAEPNNGPLHAGEIYTMYWFVGVSSSGPVAAGAVYGQARDNATWVLPAAGSEPRGNITTAQFANFTVQPVPEPSSVALVGLGSLALLTRRRKK